MEYLHRLFGVAAGGVAMVLRLIADKYGGKDLTELAAPVASQIIKRPADFLKAVKQHCEPELFAEGHQF